MVIDDQERTAAAWRELYQGALAVNVAQAKRLALATVKVAELEARLATAPEPRATTPIAADAFSKGRVTP